MRDKLFDYLHANGVVSKVIPKRRGFTIVVSKDVGLNADLIKSRLPNGDRGNGRFDLVYNHRTGTYRLVGVIDVRSLSAINKVWFSFSRRLCQLAGGR